MNFKKRKPATRKTRILISVWFLCAGLVVSAQSESKRTALFNLENKLAIQGFDPVSYFKQNKAVKGKKDMAVSHQGVTYYFSSAANKEAFLKTPAAYEPQYGGWCAYAMGYSGEKVEINPETFKIVEGKLYLFYNAFFNNTLKSWNKEEAGLKKKADANWKKILN
ncbi:YHS domain protein [Flavobacterium pallidum]|uniref:YHS domain protein n=2 Tax=Flavobacterium pallidum TaxID=2172098 RepID=A0A2S1SGS6_9FLAO|nr:YHS domain protein [Flavobacterium pallidum]